MVPVRSGGVVAVLVVDDFSTAAVTSCTAEQFCVAASHLLSCVGLVGSLLACCSSSCFCCVVLVGESTGGCEVCCGAVFWVCTCAPWPPEMVSEPPWFSRLIEPPAQNTSIELVYCTEYSVPRMPMVATSVFSL